MALFKICRGAETNLPTTLTSGYCYFCTDTTNFYIDYTDTYGALTRAKIASKYADKLRYTEDGNFIELDPTDIVTKSNYETAIGVVTSDKNGLMSSSDKTKLDGISSGATAVSIDTTLTQRGQAADAKAVGDELAKKLDNPQTAAVGNVLTVEEVDENGKPTKWKTAPAAAEQVQADIEELDNTSPAFIKNNPFKPAKTWEETLRKSTYMNSDTYNGMQVYKYYFPNNQLGDRKFILKVNDAITYNIEPTFDALKNALIQNGIVWLETKDASIIFAASESDDIHLYQSYYQLDHQTLPPANMEGSYTPGGFICKDIDTEHENISNYEQCKFYHLDGRLSYPSLYAPKTVKTFDKFDDIKADSSKGDMLWYLSTGAVSDSMGLTDADMPVMCFCTYAEFGSAAKNTKFYIETATGRKFRTYNDQYNFSSKWTTCEEIMQSSAFYINITSTTDDSGNTTYSADKTADEIIAAYESGAVIIGVYGDTYMQGIMHNANPHELVLMFTAQYFEPFQGVMSQGTCTVVIDKDNKGMDVSYEQNVIMLDEGIVFDVNNDTVQASGSFENIFRRIISALNDSKSLDVILEKGAAVYNLSRLEGTSNGILIKFDDVINSKTYIVSADSKNKAFTYSEEDLPSGGSTGEIDPKKIPDMYYTGVGSVDIAGKIITSVTLYRNEEGTLEKTCPFELGQVWKVIMDRYTSGELEVKQSSDGTLYIGDLNKGNPPFYITATSSSANPNWLSSFGVSSNENGYASLVGVSGTMSGGEIIHKIPQQYIPDVVALKNELPDMAIKVIELDNVIAYPIINIDDVDKPVLAIFKCDKNTQFKFDSVRIRTPLRERYTDITYQSGANSENPYACMMILIKKIASSDDMFEAICLNAKTKGNTILDIDNSGFENKDYASLPDGTYNFLSTYTSGSSHSYRIKGFTTVTNHDFKCYDTGDSIMFNSNGSIARYGRAYSITETDPTVPKWAKAATKPKYTAEEVGALPNTTVIPTVPTTLPNPHKLTFTGAVTGEYDGSSAVAIEIPKGGKASANFLIQPNGTVLSAPTYAQLTSGAYASFYALYGGTLYALSQQTQTSGTFTFKFNDVPNGKMYVVTVDSSDNTTFAEEDLPTTTVTLKTWTSADIS